MLTMHADKDVLADAIRAGASGYLVKDCSTEEVAEAIRMAASGDTALSPQLAAIDARRGPPPRGADGPGRRGARRSPSARRRSSSSSPTAAPPPRWPQQLYISQKTVKNHLASIYQKLDARDRTQAVLQAVRMGIVHLDLRPRRTGTNRTLRHPNEPTGLFRAGLGDSILLATRHHSTRVTGSNHLGATTMISTYEFLATWLRARFGDSERGASLVEYALLVALIAVVCIVAIRLLGKNANTSFRAPADSLDAAGG